MPSSRKLWKPGYTALVDAPENEDLGTSLKGAFVFQAAWFLSVRAAHGCSRVKEHDSSPLFVTSGPYKGEWICLDCVGISRSAKRTGLLGASKGGKAISERKAKSSRMNGLKSEGRR